MATINISGGQINIAGCNSAINAVQLNYDGELASGETQVNMVRGNGQIRTVQVNANGQQYSETVYESNN